MFQFRSRVLQARGVVTLKLGSIKVPREEKSGQVLAMDWLPQKPHNIIAIGFYDGINRFFSQMFLIRTLKEQTNEFPRIPLAPLTLTFFFHMAHERLQEYLSAHLKIRLDVFVLSLQGSSACGICHRSLRCCGFGSQTGL